MAKSRRTYNGSDQIVKWYRGKVAAIQSETRSAMENAAEEGEELVKHYIETRGTEKSGKRGRIDTGDMYDRVTHRVQDRRDGNVRIDFGWLTGRGAEEYQEGGTQTIEGMYALTDAADEVFIDLSNEIGQALKRA